MLSVSCETDLGGRLAISSGGVLSISGLVLGRIGGIFGWCMEFLRRERRTRDCEIDAHWCLREGGRVFAYVFQLFSCFLSSLTVVSLFATILFSFLLLERL